MVPIGGFKILNNLTQCDVAADDLAFRRWWSDLSEVGASVWWDRFDLGA